jgi:hypothetical protein
LITAVDGELNSAFPTDGFRIKIVNLQDQVVYDNKIGAGEDSDAVTALGGGSITIKR